MLSIGEITAREQIYQFLTSMLLKEPTPELIQGLVDTLPLLKDIFSEEVSFNKWDQILENYQSGQLKIVDLQQDFYDLFFVPTSGIYAPAVESIVVHQKMWGETELEISQRFLAAKYNPDELTIYTPFKQLGIADLLGYELGYMAHLCQMETLSPMEIRSNIQQEELTMLNDHLIPFIQKYNQSSLEKSSDTLYKTLFQLIEKFLMMDQELISNSEVSYYA